jgi:RNA-directed DNA polymerase
MLGQKSAEGIVGAGVDDIGIAEFKDHLKQHWPTIKAKLLAGEYRPSPVRRVDIPKPQGGVRTLGIPTLTDRLIQQALHQVLSPIFEADFSESSYGFRPGRNAHQAVKAAQAVRGRRPLAWWTWTWRNSSTGSTMIY